MRILYRPHVGDIYELVNPLEMRDEFEYHLQTFPAGTKLLIEQVIGTSYTYRADKLDRVRICINLWGVKTWVYFDFLSSDSVVKVEN